MVRLLYITTFVGITAVWTTFPRGCQSSFSQEYRIICKNARFVFLFATNTANLSAWLLSYKLGEYKSKLSHTITSQAELRRRNMKAGSPSWDTESSEHVSDIGSHSRWVGCHNTLFRQLIPFLQGVLQPSYQFSSWGGNSGGGINPLMLGQPQEVGYIICVTEAEAGGPRRPEWPWMGCLEKSKVIPMTGQPSAPKQMPSSALPRVGSSHGPCLE